MNSQFTIAVHSLALLAHRTDRLLTSDMIAKSICTNPTRIRSVLAILKRAGYVKTKEGTGGGYCLSVQADQIQLSDIYELTSKGSLKPSWCSGDNERNDCLISCNISMVMDRVYEKAEDHIIAQLDKLSIFDVLSQLREIQASKA